MKTKTFLSAICLLSILCFSCQNASKAPNESQASVDSTKTEEADKDTIVNSQQSTYSNVDARTFGLLGNVAQVVTTTYEATKSGNRFIRGNKVKNPLDTIAFNKLGLVTHDPFGNEYHYDDEGHFQKGLADYTRMERNADGRIANYDHQEDDEDANCHHHKFIYDAQGRVAKLEMGFYESTCTYTFTFEGDNLWPTTMSIDSMDEGNVYQETTRYRYTQFDKQGNWTERELNVQCLEAEEDPSDGELINKKQYGLQKIETRTISYY